MATDLTANQLSGPDRELATSPPIAEAVTRAIALFDDAVGGIILYGSFARGELREGSDIDLLIVLDEAVPLTRNLYRIWDAQPLSWNKHSVEVHFAHLPVAGAPLSGLWAEIALDGIVVHERGLAVSHRLAALRREILAGRLERRTIHGQPFWAQVA